MKRISIGLVCLLALFVWPQTGAHPVRAQACFSLKCPRLNIAIAYPAAGEYSVRLSGDYLESNTTVSWRIMHAIPEGNDEVTGSTVLADNPYYIVAYTHSCPSGHILADAKGRADARLGGEEVTAHFEGVAC